MTRERRFCLTVRSDDRLGRSSLVVGESEESILVDSVKIDFLQKFSAAFRRTPLAIAHAISYLNREYIVFSLASIPRALTGGVLVTLSSIL